MNLAVIVGSLRKASHSRKVARAMIERAPHGVHARIVEIGDLSLYNEDLDASPPEAWTRFREEIAAADGVLWVTPEYNRSIPGCLKNALDIGTRPANHNAFDGMPCAVASVTPYKLGGLAGNHALRQALVYPNLPVMQQPEAYIANAAELFDDAGALKNEDSAVRFTKFMAAFATWVGKLRRRDDFAAFIPERERAASAYVAGDAKPIAAMATTHDPATFFHPSGEAIDGAARVTARYAQDAKAFSHGGTSKLEMLATGASGDLAYWTGYQLAETAKGKLKLRITEVFRREDGAWRLVHRHADLPK